MDEQYLFAGSNIIHQDDDANEKFIGMEYLKGVIDVSVCNSLMLAFEN